MRFSFIFDGVKYSFFFSDEEIELAHYDIDNDDWIVHYRVVRT
jgi:hypothetical protein